MEICFEPVCIEMKKEQDYGGSVLLNVQLELKTKRSVFLSKRTDEG
jgi:hypothetical protein